MLATVKVDDEEELEELKEQNFALEEEMEIRVEEHNQEKNQLAAKQEEELLLLDKLLEHERCTDQECVR